MVAITHHFVSAVADDPAAVLAGQVVPSKWNENHDIAMAATAKIIGRKTAGAGAAEELSLSEVLDLIGSAAQGDILYRGASAWARLPAGTAGQVLQTAGAGANPAWVDIGAPTGTISPYAGATSPTGYLLCYGQAVSRTTFAALYAVCGTTYGIGDGSTTFNVPDLRGRGAYGRDDMGGSAANRITNAGSGITGTGLGNTGGTQSKTLTTTELPTHTHSGTTAAGGGHTPAGTIDSQGAHTHGIDIKNGGGGVTTSLNISTINDTPQASGVYTASSGAHSHNFTGSAVSDHTHTFTTASSGTGSAFGTMNPAIILNYIIKI